MKLFPAVNFTGDRVPETYQNIPIDTYTFDDALIEAANRVRQPQVRIYRAPLTAVVLGRGGKPGIELELDVVREDSIPILRRQGGGCAVVIDPGNVIVSVVLPVEGIKDNRKYFDRISSWLIDVLDKASIKNVRHKGISDLTIDDRKIGGSCIYRTSQYLYYSATLLLDADLSLIDRYLKHPPREPDYRRGRSHLDFVMNVGEKDMDGWVKRLAEIPPSGLF
jgi:lipoate-protein ligase A